MRTLTVFILLCFGICSYGQPTLTDKDRFLNFKLNQNWLKITKSLDTSEQWVAINQRFFFRENCNRPIDSIQYSPIIVINGVPLHIPEKLTNQASGKILNLLNEESIDQITILDKLSKEWIFCRPFPGAVILTVDEKIAKKIFKLKLE